MQFALARNKSPGSETYQQNKTQKGKYAEMFKLWRYFPA